MFTSFRPLPFSHLYSKQNSLLNIRWSLYYAVNSLPLPDSRFFFFKICLLSYYWWHLSPSCFKSSYCFLNSPLQLLAPWIPFQIHFWKCDTVCFYFFYCSAGPPSLFLPVSPCCWIRDTFKLSCLSFEGSAIDCCLPFGMLLCDVHGACLFWHLFSI